MAQSLRTVRVLTLGSTGTQDITIAGFGTCIGAIFDMNVGNVDNTLQTTDRRSIGYCDGTRQAVSAIGAVNGVTFSDTARVERDDAVIVEIGGNATIPIEGSASFDSFITDGVRINVTDASASRFVTVTLIGGDATNVRVNISPTLGNNAGTTNIHTVGFEADLVMTSCVGVTRNVGSVVHSILSRGIAVNDGADSNFMRATFDQDQLGTTNTGNYLSDTYSTGQYFGNSLSWGGSIGSYSGIGFTVTTNSSPSQDVFAYIAIKFANTFVKASIEDTPAATGAASFGATPSTPNFLQILSAGATTLSTPTGGLNTSDFYGDATNQYSVSSFSADNVSIADNGKINKTGGLIQLDSVGTTQLDSTFTGFTGTGANFNFTTTTAKKAIALFVGEVSTGSNYYLSFDNVDDHVVFATGVNIPSANGNSFTYVFDINYNGAANQMLFADPTDYNNRVNIVSNTSIVFRAGSSNRTFTLTAPLSTGRQTLKIRKNGFAIGIYDGSNTLLSNILNIGMQNTVYGFGVDSQGSAFGGHLYSAQIYSDFTETTLVADWQSNLSGGTGVILTDAVSANNGTLTDFTGTTDSWWIAYGGGGGAVTVPVTGVQAATAVGNVTVPATGINFTVTGVQAATDVGDVVATTGINFTVTGVQAATAVGDAVATTGINFTVAGVQAATAVGNVVATTEINFTVTGVQAAVSVGNVTVLTPSVTVAVTGVAGIVSEGNIQVVTSAFFPVTGVQATLALGNVETNIVTAVPVTGVQAFGLLGNATVALDTNVLVTGVEAFGLVGGVNVWGIIPTAQNAGWQENGTTQTPNWKNIGL